jgi:hypothetical protein
MMIPSLHGGTMLLWLISMSAFADYGEIIIADDGEAYPSWLERDVHMWTNMMRVDPVAFFGPESEWTLPCDLDDFETDEKTPKNPLYYDFDLNDAGRFHSIDMYDNDWFDHASSDGTSFGDRMGRFYDESGMIGENIAMGYPDGQAALLQGWMCSAGHRANIMLDSYNELGVGVEGLYFTQDFAAGDTETSAPVAMGLHSPEYPLGAVEFLVDFQGAEPTSFNVVVDGRATPVELLYGSASRGVYQTDMTLISESDCHQYYFSWEQSMQSGTFPEAGSYLFGTDCSSDTMWIDTQLPIGGSGSSGGATEAEIRDEAQEQLSKSDVDVVGCSCSSGGNALAGRALNRAGTTVGMLALIGGLFSRRRKG